jgi:hypothetical protein
VTTTTRFLQDIVRQRAEMGRTIDHLMGPGHIALCLDLESSSRSGSLEEFRTVMASFCA